MRRRIRVILAIGVLVPVMMLSGCLFNIFQTARMVQSGDAALLIGAGVVPITIDQDTAWSVAPQARLAIGLSDSINFGLHTGALISLTTGEPAWLGAMGDLKFSIINDPDSISLAAGIGGGFGLHFFGTWGIFGELLLDVNVFPLFVAYQPTYPLGGGGLLHDLAIGLALDISDKARLLIQVDTRNFAFPSYGIGFEIVF